MSKYNLEMSIFRNLKLKNVLAIAAANWNEWHIEINNSAGHGLKLVSPLSL